MYWFQEECVCELFCGKPIWQRFHFVDSTGDRISNTISWTVPNRYMHFQQVRNRSKIFDPKFTCYDLCAKKRVRMVCVPSVKLSLVIVVEQSMIVCHAGHWSSIRWIRSPDRGTRGSSWPIAQPTRCDCTNPWPPHAAADTTGRPHCRMAQFWPNVDTS